MPKAKVYNVEGKVVGERELPAAVFGAPVKPELLQQAVRAQDANSRVAIAHTKTRGEVRGGGRKPWRQKGTGRARHGSIRSPIWIGGGITFGPRPDRNFRLKINRKVRKAALLSSLSAKASEASILLVDDLTPVGKKTKLAAKLLSSLRLRPAAKKSDAATAPGHSADKKSAPQPRREAAAAILVVLPPAGDQHLAFRNLPKVTAIAADSLNVRDVLASRYLLMPVAGLERVVAVYGPKTPATAKKSSTYEPV